MSPLFGTDVVLFSPMQGKLTYQGKPAANAKIVRHLIWKDQAGTKDIFYADENGYFSIPEKIENIKIPAFGEFRIVQQLDVHYENQEFMIWVKGSEHIDKFGGLKGPLENLSCEITSEIEKDYDFPGLFGTSCKWNNFSKKD